jgi:hypothetical protein
MNFNEFTDLVSAAADPVILIEGRRAISPEMAESARKVAAFLAVRFPHLKFRSGNANGADEAFAAGVTRSIARALASHRALRQPPEKAASPACAL